MALTFSTHLIPTPQSSMLPETLLFGALALTLLAFVTLFLYYLRRRQFRKQLEQRVGDLEMLESASRAIVKSELDVAALCALIADEAGKIIDTSTFQIGLFDGSYYHVQYWRINGVDQHVPETFDLNESVGIVGLVRANQQPLLIEDLSDAVHALSEEPRYVSRKPGRSAIYLPLVSGETTIGVLAAQHPAPGQFTHQDVRRLAILANQAAAGIANAMLYDQARTRADDLEMVSSISQQVNRLQDMSDILQQAVFLTRDRLRFHPINVLGIDPETEDAVLQASTVNTLGPGTVRVPPGAGVVGAAAQLQRTVVVNDVDKDDRYLRTIGVAAYDGETSQTRSEIAIPLMSDERVIGVLDVQSDRLGGFTDREQAVLEALANEIASAMRKAALLNQQREQAWITTAQLQVADAITDSESVDEMLEALVRLTTLLVGVESCAVLLWDVTMNVYRPGAIDGVSAECERRFLDQNVPIGHWSPLDAAHVGEAVIRSHRMPPWLGEDAGRRVTLRPLIAQYKLLGMMVTEVCVDPDTADNDIFDTGRERTSELLSGIAEQAARAIERDTLQTAQREEAWVNTALLQVAEAVNSLFDLNEILGTIVRLVPMLVGVESAVLLTWDDDERAFRVGPSYGVSERALSFIDDGVDQTQLVIEAYSPDSLTEIKMYAIELPPFMQEIVGADSADFLPLHARGQLVGGLLVGASVNGRPLTGRRLNILTGIAQQAALAVVNDRLYQESAERERLEQELTVARSIQSSLIPSRNPTIEGLDVAAYWRAARQVSGDFYDFLELPDGKHALLIADVADKGIPAALFMALCRTIIRSVGSTRIDPAATLSRANDILVNDTESDLFVTVFYAVWDPVTRLVTYANGGHNPPLFIRTDGSVEALHADGIAMGIVEHMAFEERTIQVAPGDTLILYTDGVNETINAHLEEFGLDRLIDVVASAEKRSARNLVDAIVDALDAFAGSAPQFDDTTLVVVNCT